MLIGLLSDAHGNPLGLRTCLAVLRQAGARSIYFLGDAVGYMPGEAEVIAILSVEDVICQRGNHEGMLLGDLPLDPVRDQAYGLAAVRTRMSADVSQELSGWPEVRDVRFGDRRVLMVHGSPRDHLNEYVYPDSDVDWMGGLGYDAVFMGNTHRPFTTQRDGVLIVNVGSCGLPRDQGDLAACAIYDTSTNQCTILRVPVSADAITEQFAQPVTDLVSECLHRRSVNPFGSIVRPR